tara:strand:+ start:1085 stop:1258 length:174 start_codon:yes stop_codon:yes gene_type:complete
MKDNTFQLKLVNGDDIIQEFTVSQDEKAHLQVSYATLRSLQEQFGGVIIRERTAAKQ